MLKNSILLLILIGISPFYAIGQIDSLQLKLAHEKTDTSKVNLLNEIALFYLDVNIDSSFKYSNQSAELALKIGFNSGYCLSCRVTGRGHAMKSDYDKASEYYKKSLICYQKLGDKENLPKVLMYLANVYDEQGKFSESAAMYFKGHKILEAAGNKENLYNSYFNIGIFFQKYGKNQQAKKYLDNAYNIALEENNPERIVRCLNNIGAIYFNEGNYDESLIYYYQALEINKKIGSDRGMAFNYGNIANAYNYQGKFKESFQKFNEAKAIFERLGEQRFIYVANYNIGNLLYNNQKYSEAIKYIKIAIDGLSSLKEEHFVLRMYKKLAESYAENGDYKNAYQTKNFRDSLENKISVKKNLELMEELEKKYENEKQAKELAELRHETVGLALTKKKQENQRNYLVIGLMLLGGIGFYFGKKAREKTKISKMLEAAVKERTAELEGQNEKMIILLKEIHHRVKNNLQLITSILNLQLSYEPDLTAEQLAEKWKNKIKCMALIHDRLNNTNQIDKLPTKEYFSDLLNYIKEIHSSSNVSFILDVEEHHLQIDTLVPCGLIFNEIVSNALKHNFSKNNKEGLIKISFYKGGDLFYLIVSDNGNGLPEGFNADELPSMGLNLVAALVDQIDGKIEFKNNDGTVVTIGFPEMAE
jgi:two-component system, sensor histidine kinase PdtaS